MADGQFSDLQRDVVSRSLGGDLTKRDIKRYLRRVQNTYTVGPRPSGDYHTPEYWGIHFEAEKPITLGETVIDSGDGGDFTILIAEYDGTENLKPVFSHDITVREGRYELDLDVDLEPGEYLLTKEGNHPLRRSVWDKWNEQQASGMWFYGGMNPTYGPSDFWYYYFDLEVTVHRGETPEDFEPGVSDGVTVQKAEEPTAEENARGLGDEVSGNMVVRNNTFTGGGVNGIRVSNGSSVSARSVGSGSSETPPTYEDAVQGYLDGEHTLEEFEQLVEDVIERDGYEAIEETQGEGEPPEFTTIGGVGWWLIGLPMMCIAVWSALLRRDIDRVYEAPAEVYRNPSHYGIIQRISGVLAFVAMLVLAFGPVAGLFESSVRTVAIIGLLALFMWFPQQGAA